MKKIKIKTRKILVFLVAFAILLQTFYPIIPFLPSFGKKETVSANEDILAVGEKEKVMFQNVNPEFKVEFGNKEAIDKPFMRFESISSGDNPFAKEENEKIKPGLIERLVSSVFKEKKQGIELTLLSAGNDLATNVEVQGTSSKGQEEDEREMENGELKMKNTNNAPVGADLRVRPENRNTNEAEESDEKGNDNVTVRAPLVGAPTSPPAQDLNVLLSTETKEVPASVGAGLVPAQTDNDSQTSVETPLVSTRTTTTITSSPKKSPELLDAEAEVIAEEKILEQMEKELDNMINDVDWKLSSNEEMATKKAQLKRQIMDDLLQEEEAKAQTVVESINLETVSDPGEKKKDVIKNIDFVPGVDAEYSIKEGEGVKEEIIIKNSDSFSGKCIANKVANPETNCFLPKNAYTFSLKLDADVNMRHAIGIMNEKNPQGVTYFENSKGKYLFHFEPLFAIDAKGNRTDAVRFEITEDNNEIGMENGKQVANSKGEGLTIPSREGCPNNSEGGVCQEKGSDLQDFTHPVSPSAIHPSLEGILHSPFINIARAAESKTYTLKVIVDPSWLLSPERAFPVRIDPSIVHNTKVQFDAGSALNRVETTSDPKIQEKNLESKADANTVGLWHMNETSGTTVTDSSGKGNNGTATGTTIVDGKMSKARSFNGSSDYVDMGLNSPFRQNNAISYEYWVKIPVGGGGKTMGSGASGGNGYGGIFTSLTQFGFGWTPSGPNSDRSLTSTSLNLTPNQWHHIVFSIDYISQYYLLYVNGESRNLTLSSAISGSWIPQSSYSSGKVDYIGARYVNSLMYFNGLVDEVKISNVALTPEQIKADYSKTAWAHYTSSVLDLSTDLQSIDSLQWSESGVGTGDAETPYSSTGLVGHWKFNETSGTTAADSSGSGNNGTLTNFSNTTGQDVVANSGWTANNGKWPRSAPKALMFDGSDDYVSMGNNVIINETTGFTTNFWVKTTSVSDYMEPIRLKGSSTEFVFALGKISNSALAGRSIYFGFRGNQSLGSLNSKYFLDNLQGEWHYFSITYNGGTKGSTTSYTLFVDGQPVTVELVTGNTIGGSTNTNEIGKDGGSAGYLRGIIDNVQVYNRVLSADEILANYNATNIEFQTRTGTDATPDDGGWEDWKPNTSESQLLSMDADQNNWDGKFDQYTKLLMHADGTNGLTSFSDKSLFTKTLTRAGDAQVSTAQSKFGGSSAYFDGTGDYISSPTSNDWNFGSSDFTIDLWIKKTDAAGYYPILSRDDGTLHSSTYHNTFQFVLYPSSVYFDVQDGSSTLLSLNPSVTNDTAWHHYAIVRNGSSWKLYYDGVVLASATSNITIGTVTRNFMIGGGLFTNTSWFFNGYIDELRVSKGIARWTSNFTPPSVAYYNPSWVSANDTKVDNDGNTKLLLHSDGNNNSTAFADSSFGQKSVSAVGDAKISTAQSKFGGASAYFDGTGDYLSSIYNDDWNFGLNDFTIDFWMYLSDTGVDRAIIERSDYNGGSGNGFSIQRLSSNKLRVYEGNAGGDSSGTLSANTWYHIAVVRNGSLVKTYINGNEQISFSAATIGISGTPLLWVGHSNYISELNGYIDELRISKGIARWTSGFSVPTSAYTDPYNQKIEGTGSMKVSTGQPQTDANTVGLWHLDETGGTGAYLKDISGNGNHGTPTGTNLVNGIAGKARSFNGSSDYVANTSPVRLPSGGNSFTLSGWFKTNVIDSSYHRILFYGAGGVRDAGFGISNTGYLTFVEDGITEYMDNTTLLNTNTWYLGTVTYDGSNLKLWINGNNIRTWTGISLNIVTSTQVRISGKLTGTEKWNGLIDEVLVSNVARTPEEIAESYRMGRDHRISRTITSTDLSSKTKLPFWVAGDRPGTYMEATVGESAFANYEPDGNTVGLWHLDEQSGSGAYIKDSSNFGNHGTPTGTTFTQGKVGKARIFNGSSDYIQFSSPSTSLGTTATISAWVKNNVWGSGNTDTVIDLYNSADPSNKRDIFTIKYWSSNAQLNAMMRDSANNWYNAGAAVTYSTDSWYYVTIMRNGTSLKIYINGIEAGSTTVSSNSFYNFDSIRVGDSSVGEFWQGLIDEVRIDNIARTTAEIRQAYEVGLRTHPITIEFNAKLDAGNLIANSGDTSFTIDTTASGSYSNKGENLFNGDKIIIKENYDGTEYLAQGTVTSVNVSTGAITVASWDSGSTFPGAGFTANATVFKWQREFMDLTAPLTSQMDAVNRLTLRCTDGNEGRNIFLDDFKAGGPYLTTPNATGNVTSTKNRYMQYRAMFSTTDGNVTPALTGATVNYSNGPSSTDVLMRHGRWFDSTGTLKPHWWGR